MANPPANRRPGVDADIFQGQWVRGFDVPAGNNDPAADPCDLIISNGKSQIDQTVSNLIFANRKDDLNQPIFVMAQGDDAQAPIGTVNFHIGREEDPNGLITASTSGSLYASYGTPGLWQLQADNTTWIQISDDLGGEDLQQTLAIGNTTGGFSILLTNGDFLKGENSAVGDGASANIAGGNATGAAGNGGDVNVLGGTTAAATGRTGNLLFSSPVATGTGGSGRFDFTTGDSQLGGASGGFLVRTGDAGNVGIGGTAGTVQLRAGRSFSTGALGGGGRADLIAGQATEAGRGGNVRIFSGNATTTGQLFPLPLFVPGRAGDIELRAGVSSNTEVGGAVSLYGGTGGSGGGEGGQILLRPGVGGGGADDGEVIADGIFRADNIKRGNGDPNVGSVAGNEGDVYQRLDLGLGQIWLNTNGTPTGWVQLAKTGDFIEAFEQMSWGWVGPAGANVGGVEEDSYDDVGIWHGLRPNNINVGGGGGTISRGQALNDGPVLAFTVDTTFAGNLASLDLSTGGGNPPHAREQGPIITFRVKTTQISNFRIFLGLTTLTAPNQLATDFPAGGSEYMGFLASPGLGDWQTITRNGLGTAVATTSISKIATQANSDAFWFIIDASDTATPTVKFFVLDPNLNLVSSIIQPLSLPNGNTRLGLAAGIVSTAFVAGTASLLLDHAAIVNQGGVVGQGGGPGLGGLSLSQVLINGNTTGFSLIEINQGSGILGVTDDNVGDGASFGVFGGATTLVGNDTGGVFVASGNAFGGGAEAAGATTGLLVLSTGFQFSATSAGDTGIIDVQTGDHAGTNGTTGDFVLRTGGFINGAAGTRVQGDILIAPGSFLPNTATTTGEIILKGGSSSLTNVTGGDVTILSGENNSAIGDTGDINIETFDANLDGDSGDIEIATGSGGTITGDSGNLTLQTSTTPAGNSGFVGIGVGAAPAGTTGGMLLIVGNNGVGDGGDVFIIAGTTTDAVGVGGNIEMSPGTGLGGDGAVIINGKLTVTGIIDPTALVLDGQAVIPPEAVPTAGQGTLWVDNTVVPSRLFFTDDLGTPTNIGTGGGVTSLGALTDVTLAGPVPGEVLTFNGAQWVNLAGVGGSPLATILGIGNTTGALPIVVSGTLGSRITSDGPLRLSPAVAAGNAVVIDGLAWPEADGPNGFVLTTNGAGQLSFQPGGGSGGPSFGEAFTRMQWGTVQAATSAPWWHADGFFTNVTTTPAVLTPSSNDVNGYANKLATAGAPGSNAGFEIEQTGPGVGLELQSLPVVSIKFDGPTPGTVNRFFVGLTDAPNLGAMTGTFPVQPGARYVGVQIFTDLPQTTLHFVTDDNTGIPTTVNTTAAPSLLGLELVIDASVAGAVTLTLYDNTGTQLSTTTFGANLPLASVGLGVQVGVTTRDAIVKIIGFYGANAVTRADLLNAVGGGGGNQNLASVLGFGGETGGLPITGDNNVAGNGGSLDFLGGASTGGAGNGGDIQAATGTPDPAGNGQGGDFLVTGATGAGLGRGGEFQVIAGTGGALGGDGGNIAFTPGAGPGAASADGGSFFVFGATGGGTGGEGGRVEIVAGDALAGNFDGGRVGMAAGDASGIGTGGAFVLTAGDGGAGGGDGGSLTLTAGAGLGGGADGVITLDGEVFITGKLNVVGMIDPPGLLMSSSGIVPFTPVGTEGGIWVNAAGELVYTNAGGDLNLSTAIGGGMTFLDALLTAQYGFLGPGNMFGGPQSYGVFGSSVNGAVSPGPPPASAVLGQDSDGPFLNMAVAADPGGSEVFLGTSELQIQRDSQFKSRFKFQVTSPAHTDERIFIGYTDDATQVTPNPQLALDHPIPGLQYMGLAQSLAGFNLEFVAQGSGGAMAAVFAIPTDALVHYFEIDASDPSGDVTFTIYDGDGVTISGGGTATHTEPASLMLPDLALPTRPFIGITNSTSATTPRSLDFYDATVITRADVVNAVTGGGSGGTSPLAAVLAAGNTTGANGIEFSLLNTGITSEVNPAGPGQDLDIEAGGTSLAGADGGRLRMVGGVDGGAPGKPGGVLIGSDTTVPISATASGAVKLAGADSASATGANLSVSKGETTPGDLSGAAGNAIAPNTSGGAVLFSGGTSTGTGQGGNVDIVGGGTSASSSGDGGYVTIQAGSLGPLSTGQEGGIALLAGNASPVFAGEGAIQIISATVFGGSAATSSIGIFNKADTITGDGGNITFQVGAAEVGSGGEGGDLVLQASMGDGAGVDGSIHLLANGAVPLPVAGGGDVQLVGASDAAGSKGGVVVAAKAVGGLGGIATVTGGNAGAGTGGTGGSAAVTSGTGDGVGAGGFALLRGGQGGATGDGGDAQVRGGGATGGVNVGGDVRLIPGSAPGGQGEVLVEGPFNNAAPGIQFGKFVGVLPAGGVHFFNVPFPSPPRAVFLTLEGPGIALAPAVVTPYIALGSIGPASLTIAWTGGVGPAAPVDINYMAFL